jgi:hypothetical protein
MNGRKMWFAYRFGGIVYYIWMSKHLDRGESTLSYFLHLIL